MRSADQLTEQILKFIPGVFSGMEPLLGGTAGVFETVEVKADELAQLTGLGESEGIWLTLRGQDLGVLRAPQESDQSLVHRIRDVEDAVTRTALKNTVEALLDTGSAQIIEWYEGPYLDVELEGEGGMWLDSARLSGGPNSFQVIIEPQGTGFEWSDFMDADLYLDSGYMGLTESPIYGAIINQVNRKKAAGTFWRLVLDA